MELKVEEIKALAPIQFNYEDIKKWITEKAKEYKSMVYTEETITNAKSDRATLNKVAKALNDEKIRIKKEVLKPFEDFESKCKELQGIITDASNSIDIQVKAFETKEQEEKKKQIEDLFNTYIGDFKELIIFEQIFNQRWLNKTYTIKKIEDEIKHLIAKTTTDLKVIDAQIQDESINKSVKNYYFNNITDPSILGNSLQEGMKIDENNKKLEQLRNTQKATSEEQNIKENSEKITNIVSKTENLIQIDFRVITTKEKFMKLKEFLEINEIDYRRV
ncbi:MAG: DUF1351 domain-containing protein [Clostridia bacterium]|jgi:hypothetical protein